MGEVTKHQEREALQKEIERFLLRGGRIQRVAAGVSGKRPPDFNGASTSENKKKGRQPKAPTETPDFN